METTQIKKTPQATNAAALIEMEKAVLEAFKNKKDDDFTKNFAQDYIGVANDGVKDSAGEVAGLHKMNLDALSMTDEKISFPAQDTAIITYKMLASGEINGQHFSSGIYCSTVYLKRENKWEAVLHTESKSG